MLWLKGYTVEVIEIIRDNPKVLILIQKLIFIIGKIYFIEYKYPMFISSLTNFVSEKSSISFRMGLVSTVLTLRLAIIGLALVLMVFAFGIENNGF